MTWLNDKYDVMTTLRAASTPSTSSVGSASAKPSLFASSSASSNVVCSLVILDKIKLEVPFKIPINFEILFAFKPLFMAFTIGIPPATLASNFKATPFSSAKSSKSLRCTANKSLFAVITCFLFLSAVLNQSTVGSIPPMTSTIISNESSFKISLTSSVK
ncbi:Uncharacterised protein [Staphylococcus aureus]|nr:Uncharacterised protein [Staphylococcus aureus]CPJ33274.1 Uncharacterised protein [Staphylococcus aureus]CPJ35002.1 Uncharacterised protein [Staphylococcus aureus]CPM03260.1 Uncharacterised protein [Staphylococcus aureus]CPM96451.1 Uncharacterised protein [Staphylococcus aureus]